MPEQPATIYKWDDFSGGDYGSLGGERAPKGTFHGYNVMVRANGCIGPRPGLKNMTPNDMPNGPLLALTGTPTPGRDGMFVIAEKVYRFNMNSPLDGHAHVGDFAHAPQQPIVLKQDTATFLATIKYAGDTQDKTYRVNQITDSVTGITGSPGGSDVTLYDQTIVVADTTEHYMVEASSPTDPTDWSEGRFLDIGDNWQVTALHTLRNGLAVLKRTGLHLITGIIGDSATEYVRKISSADGPLHPWQSTRDSQDKIWFWPLFGKGPWVFDGAQATPLADGRFDLGIRESDDDLANTPLKRGVVSVVGEKSADTVLFVQGGTTQAGIQQHNKVWTFQYFEAGVSGMVSFGPEIGQIMLTDGGTNVTPAQIYSYYPRLNRPAFIGDELASIGDGKDTANNVRFLLPQYWSPAGREFEVRQVIVDFISYNTGSGQTNHFDVSLRIMQREYNRGGVEATYATDTAPPKPDPYDEAPGAVSTTGTFRRQVFNFHTTFGAGAEVLIKNVRGVDIRSVTFVGPTRDERPLY